MKYYVIKNQDKKYVKEINFDGTYILSEKQKEAKRFVFKSLAEERLLDAEKNELEKFKIIKIKSKKEDELESFLNSQTKKLTKEEKDNYLKELQTFLRKKELREELKALNDYNNYDSYGSVSKESDIAENMNKILLKQELLSNNNVKESLNSIDEAIKNIPDLINTLDLILNKNDQASLILKEHIDDLIKNQKAINDMHFKEDSKIRRASMSKLQELITKTKNSYKMEDLKELFKEVVKEENKK